MIQKKEGGRNFYLKLSEPIDINIWKYGNVYGDKMEIKKMIADTLDGGVSEFYHVFEEGGAVICLRTPIDQVKDIDSAIKKAMEAGFDAEVMNYGGYRYLEIRKFGYIKEVDHEVVEKLKNVAIEVSKEDYLDHIENLPLTLETYPENMVILRILWDPEMQNLIKEAQKHVRLQESKLKKKI